MTPENDMPKLVRQPREEDKKLCMTQGYALFGVDHPREAYNFIRLSMKLLGKTKGEPSMTVGAPDIKIPEYQDEGRTVLLPIDARAPKVYACQNETGGYTFMLAEEY